MPLMRPFSLRGLLLGISGILVSVAILTLVVAALFFRAAMFHSQQQTLGRMVGVAGDEALRHLGAQLFSFGTEFQARPAFRSALQQRREGETDGALRTMLQDPFAHGFSGMREIDLAALRVYDADLKLLAESAGEYAMPSGLAPVLRDKVAGREGSDRLKAVSVLWSTPEHTFFSVLLPIGGLRLLGYLEVIADPAYSLQMVGSMTAMPLTILDARGRILHESSAGEGGGGDTLAVVYELRDESGTLAYRLISQADVADLNARLLQTLLVVIALVVLLAILVAALLWTFFSRVMLRPAAAMQSEMKRCADGDLSVTVGHGMLKDFNVLADAFNEMARQLAVKIAELQHMSHVDSLTGLANRHHFDQCVQKEWRRALRERTPLSLLMVDVDFFKRYNDCYGHVAGDECLRQVAAAIGGVVQRSTDLAVRYGGEEFSILLPGTPLANARKLAENLLASLAAKDLPHAESPLGRVSVSIGMASCNAAECCKPTDLIQAADEALYAAKRNGRNTFAVSETVGNGGKCEDCSKLRQHARAVNQDINSS